MFESSALDTSNYMETTSELPKLRPGLGKRLLRRIVLANQAELVKILVNASTPWIWLKTSRAMTWMSPFTIFSFRVRPLPNFLLHRSATQKRNSRTLREVKSSLKTLLAEVLVVVVVNEDVDVVVVVDEIAVVGSRFCPTSLLLKSSS